jgi:hypothetical protein
VKMATSTTATAKYEAAVDTLMALVQPMSVLDDAIGCDTVVGGDHVTHG